MPVTPHITDQYAPLDALIVRAIRRFGDFGAQAAMGDVQNMFIEFANQVVDDYLNHPYFDGRTGVEHYISADEWKPIEDQIILSGLIAHYSFQQSSEKTPGYQSLYYMTMNKIMWQALNGNTPLNMRPTDGGSNKAIAKTTSVINGLVVADDST